jgi:hypothetical protein
VKNSSPQKHLGKNRQLLVAAKRYTQLSDPERAVTKGVKKDIE